MATHDKPVVNLWYLTRYLGAYRWPAIWTMIFLIAGRIASSLDPIWLKKIIDQIATHHPVASGPGTGGVGQSTVWMGLGGLVAIYFGLKALTFVFDYLRDVIFAPTEMGIARTLSRQLFTHLLDLPVAYHYEQKIGALSRQITRGGRAITFLLDFTVINILPTMVELVVVAALLLRLYPPVYASITVLTIAAYSWFTVWSTEKRQIYRLGANEADDEVAGVEVDALTNIETVKYFHNEDQMRRRYLPAIDLRYRLNVLSNRLFALISAGQALILLVGMGLILLIAIRAAIAGLMTVGDLVLLTTYMVRLSAPIGVLGFVYRAIKDGLADMDAMARILAETSTLPEPEHPRALPHPRGEVELQDVTFAYPNKPPVLRNINLQVTPGQRVAFVGASGAGKSTLVKLLFRLFDPTGGQILVDGVDLRELSWSTRRELLGLVPQETALFNTTIEENIRFGKPEATTEEVRQAASLASLDALLAALPEGLQTVVGERGIKLSGGEKQRVAIARAIIRNPRILVFDEATSSLDSKSEQMIQQALDAIAEGRTTIAVAHRLSTIAHSDTIYVLDHGVIAESGTHQQLLAQGTLYAMLWQIQAAASEEEWKEAEVALGCCDKVETLERKLEAVAQPVG